MNPPDLRTVVVNSGDGAQQIASWTRGAVPFVVRVRVATNGGPTYIAATADAGQAGFRFDDGDPELSFTVPALAAGDTAVTEGLWAFETSGVAWVSTAIDPT